MVTFGLKMNFVNFDLLVNVSEQRSALKTVWSKPGLAKLDPNSLKTSQDRKYVQVDPCGLQDQDQAQLGYQPAYLEGECHPQFGIRRNLAEEIAVGRWF